MHSSFEYDEKALLVQVAAGNESAFRSLFDAYRNRLYFFIFRLTLSKEVAEDVLQDTFLKIWLNRDNLDRVEHFNAYLFRVAQNGVLTGLRRKAVEASILQDNQDPSPLQIIPDQQLHYKQVKATLQEAIETLPPQQKKVFLLRREEGRKIQEIATLMNISGLTVKKHLTAAQKTIRQALENSFPDDWAILLIILGLEKLL
ncbi:RNA polymerase sigma factor [Niastella caeni]|uniref:RNA polymerase sigma factor n=1 Tax=Niastella caeni TaxID=2569763 RepID=UPI00140A5581|nr:RNA polymerase sigma-70 factor [Niastella caeni]